MKKLFALAMMVMAILGFTACESGPNFDDPDYKGVYSYVTPCLQWNASMEDVRAYMKDVKGWNSSSSQLGNYDLIFRQSKTHNDITYTFHGGKLTRVTVTWYGCQEDFDRMREEYASKMNFTWEKAEGVRAIYQAISHELKCDIEVHMSQLNGARQMGITFDYAQSY